MRRDSLTLEVEDIEWLDREEQPRQPTLTVSVADGADDLGDRLRSADDRTLGADDLDVSVRFREPEGSDRDGVLALTNRLTGEFILELNVPGSDVVDFVTAARRYGEQTGDAARYRVRVVADGSSLLDLEKRTLLVYSSEGELLRERSLIPSGVEI